MALCLVRSYFVSGKDCEWMHADVAMGLFGINALARFDPFRWSGSISFDKCIKQLEEALKEHGDGSITVKSPSGISSKENTFNDIASAIAFVKECDPARQKELLKEGLKSKFAAEQAERHQGRHDAEEAESIKQKAEQAELLRQAMRQERINRARENIDYYDAKVTETADNIKVLKAEKEGKTAASAAVKNPDCKWMFGDAPRFARLNYLRWSGEESFDIAVVNLEAQKKKTDRAILVLLPAAPPSSEHRFPDCQAAIDFIKGSCPKHLTLQANQVEEGLKNALLTMDDATKRLQEYKDALQAAEAPGNLAPALGGQHGGYQRQETLEQDQAAKIQKVSKMTGYAQLCGNASAHVYTVKVPEILTTASLPGVILRLQRVYPSSEAHNGCAVWSDADHAVIAFKGTDNLAEVELDFRTIATGTDETGEPFDIDQIYNDHCVEKKKGVFITGHSLGGSRALHYGLKYVSQHKAAVHAFNPGSSVIEGLDRLTESFETHVGPATSFVHHIGGDVISMGNQPKYGNITYIVYETKFRPHSIMHFVDFNTIRVRTDLPENLKCTIMTYQTSDTITKQTNELGHDDLISISASADQADEEDFTLKFNDHTGTNVLVHWGTQSCSEITVKPGKHYIISYLANKWSVEEVPSIYAHTRLNARAV